MLGPALLPCPSHHSPALLPKNFRSSLAATHSVTCSWAFVLCCSFYLEHIPPPSVLLAERGVLLQDWVQASFFPGRLTRKVPRHSHGTSATPVIARVALGLASMHFRPPLDCKLLKGQRWGPWHPAKGLAQRRDSESIW